MGRECLQALGTSVLLNVFALLALLGELSPALPKWSGAVLSCLHCVPLFAMPLALLAIPMAFMALILGIFVRPVWRPALKTLIWCCIFSFFTILGIVVELRLWDRAFRQLAVRSSELVDAIKRYERDSGAPPPNLQALVPKYLPEIPETTASCSGYEYTLNRFNNPWVLEVRPPFRGTGFDRFEYRPNQDYPERGESGWYERIEDWAYFHE